MGPFASLYSHRASGATFASKCLSCCLGPLEPSRAHRSFGAPLTAGRLPANPFHQSTVKSLEQRWDLIPPRDPSPPMLECPQHICCYVSGQKMKNHKEQRQENVLIHANSLLKISHTRNKWRLPLSRMEVADKKWLCLSTGLKRPRCIRVVTNPLCRDSLAGNRQTTNKCQWVSVWGGGVPWINI